MNRRELENAILLRESGELSPEEEAALENALEAEPALAAWAEEAHLLQEAGRYASRHTVPALAETERERILTASKGRSDALPRLLAIAAVLVLALGLWPHFAEPFHQEAPRLTAQVKPIREDLTGEDPLLSSLDRLETEIEQIEDLALDDDHFVEDPDYWASELLKMENTI